MMRSLLALLPLAAEGYSLRSGSEVAANPIRRIVTLLQDMKKEIEADAEKEEELFKAFMCYCKNNDGQLSEDARVAEETISTNNAAAEEKSGMKKQLEEELKQHKKDRSEAQKTLKEETERRAKEKAAYDEAAGDTGKYIDGTTKAKAALERGRSGKMPRNPDDFLQTREASMLKKLVSISKIDVHDQNTVLAFLQGDYHTVGSEIIGILDNMLEEFKKTLGGLVETEEAAVKAFGELKAAKLSEIQLATKSIEQKQETKGRLAVEIVQHQNAATTAAKELSDAEAFLANLKQSCADKQADWDARSKARVEELSAIQEAIDVLNDDDALDIFKKAVKPAPKASFLQIQKSRNIKARVSNMLKKVHSSPVISLMASTTLQKLKSTSTVDFSKIIIMIDDMIKLLKEEQVHDANTQKWCQDEFRSNAADTKETKANIASLASEIEALEAAIAEHTETIAKKQAEVAELDKSVAEATEQRKKENEEFNALMALNNSAVQLIEKAKNKLHKFYNPGQYKAPEDRELTDEEHVLRGAGQDIGDTTATTAIAGTEQVTTVFLQTASEVDAPSLPAPPETYGEHKSKGQKSNSVIALLDLMQNDLKSETQAAQHEEKTAQRDYETLLADAAKQRAAAEQAVAESQGAIAEAEENKNTATTDKQNNEATLAELEQTKENLHKECDFILEHFEERREARTTEIDGLTTAKSVLSGAAFE
jgi:septal ring factor EnvC (AmiA/AmiB activator)